MADENPAAAEHLRGNWVMTFAAVAAPTTFIGALLLFFGYSYTHAFYAYFRIDAVTLGFSTQEYTLRSAGALYVPAGTALLVALVGVLAYYAAVALGKRPMRPPLAIRVTPPILAACGAVFFVLGMMGGFGAWGTGSMDTPLLLGGGLVLLLYGRVLSFKLAGADYPVAQERLALALVIALIALASFWTTHAYAKKRGHDDAAYLADRLWLRPMVTIETTQRLYIPHRGVRETVLPATGTDQRFHFRYEGLRLLAEQNGRMFVIPQTWSPGDGRVIVLPTKADVRVTFRSG
ncbi:hypothetical protein ACWCQL_20780 [Streptomyces sp. NPDC002073]